MARRGYRGGLYGRLIRIADIFGTFTFMLLVVGVIAFVFRVGEQEINGPLKVLDGDSLQGPNGARYRLRGIDAPEYLQTCDRSGQRWDCGREAAQKLRAKISVEDVRCSGSELDKYDRLLVTCENGRGENINRWMVRNGWAIAFGDYHDEERVARGRQAGIWASQFDEPRDWRDNGNATTSQEANEWAQKARDEGVTLLNSLSNRVRLWLQILNTNDPKY